MSTPNKAKRDAIDESDNHLAVLETTVQAAVHELEDHSSGQLSFGLWYSFQQFLERYECLKENCKE